MILKKTESITIIAVKSLQILQLIRNQLIHPNLNRVQTSTCRFANQSSQATHALSGY